MTGRPVRLIRVSSRALGPRRTVRVYIYNTPHDMRAAATRFTGEPITQAYAVTQAWTDNTGRAGPVIIRLAHPHLNINVISHEMHHAATAIYGAHAPDRPTRTHHLNHHNEPFAYLYSDLLTSLLNQLHTHGYTQEDQ